MSRNFIIFSLVILFMFSLNSAVSGRSPQAQPGDSTGTDLLQKLDSVQVADSLQRIKLEKEIEKLKSTDNLKKQELLSELEALKKAEEQKRLAKIRQIDSLKLINKGVPVAPFGDTILVVYVNAGNLTAKERADLNIQRIKKVADEYFVTIDSLKIVRTESTVDLLYHDLIVASVTDNDALWMGMSKMELAELYRTRIVASINAYNDSISFKTLAVKTGLALLVLIGLFLVVKLINKGFNRYKKFVSEKSEKWFKGIKMKDYEFISPKRQEEYFFFFSNLVRLFVIVVVVYLSLPLLFSIFPWTKNIGVSLIGFVWDPVKKIVMALVNYLPNFITIVVILTAFFYIHKFVRYIAVEIENGKLKVSGFYPDWAMPTYNIVRVMIFAFAVIVIFPYLPGSDSPVFQGVSVFLGFLFTLSSAGSLSNIIAGTVLTYMRAYQIGDFVKIGDTVGNIVEKTLLVTRVRTKYNEVITIPNSTIMNSNTVNYTAETRSSGLILKTHVTIGYDAPWKQVHELLIQAAERTEKVLKEPKPFVLQVSLDDFYIKYELCCFTRFANDQGEIYSVLHQNIQDCFNEAKVEIMSPHYKANRDGSAPAIPASYFATGSGGSTEDTADPGKK